MSVRLNQTVYEKGVYTAMNTNEKVSTKTTDPNRYCLSSRNFGISLLLSIFAMNFSHFGLSKDRKISSKCITFTTDNASFVTKYRFWRPAGGNL